MRISTVAKTVTRMGLLVVLMVLQAAALSPVFFASLALEALAVVTTAERPTLFSAGQLHRPLATNTVEPGRMALSLLRDGRAATPTPREERQ